MTVKLFNTLTRKVDDLKTLEENTVKMYTCGPTVYNYPHIGNYRAYIVSDVLKRYLRYRNYSVDHVMNITDVDDKTIKGSQRKKMSLSDFTEEYEQAFFEDLQSLNILPPTVFTRATEYIPEMVEIIKKLLEKGLAYTADDGIYFSVSKFKSYGELAKLDLSKLKIGASGRVAADEYSKEDVHDFALWKNHVPEDGEVFWETEIGKGRPGWHIECSAMSMKHLGSTFDIHTGGIDLIFPHRQNEIAQSEGSTGRPFVKHWVHNEWLLVEGQKMSKSEGNFYTLRNILKKGYDPSAIRYLLLSTHYRQQLNFTFNGLDAAQSSIERLQELIRNLRDADPTHPQHEQIIKLITDARLKFNTVMDDDLNISEGLAAIFDFVRDINKLMEAGINTKDADDVITLLQDFDEVLGVMNFVENFDITPEQKRMVEQREQMRKSGNFKEADNLRDRLKELGIILEDTPRGIKWKKLK